MSGGILTTESRDINLSKGELNDFRKAGKVPAVIFGKGMDSVPVFVNLIEFRKVYHDNGKIFELKFGSHKETVNAKTIDTTPLGMVSHISFQKLTKGEKTTVKVPVTLEGDCIGLKAGGMIQQLIDTITVHAVPKDIPESIHVDISALEVGHHISVSDLKLPKGLEVDASELERNIVNCQAPQKQEEEAPAESQVEAAPAGDDSTSNEA